MIGLDTNIPVRCIMQDARLQTRQIQVEQADRVIHALRAHATGQSDFADGLIERSAAAAGGTHTP